jgi:transcriptional regulator with XRE-family HTH domain
VSEDAAKPLGEIERQAMIIAFGRRVRQLRMRAGLSEDELAARCGFINPKRITQIERSAGREPSLTAIVQLCWGLDVLPDILLAGLVLAPRESA